MIEVHIKTNKGKILDDLTKKDTCLEEVGVVVVRLEQIKQELISIDFKSDIEFTKGGDDDGPEN